MVIIISLNPCIDLTLSIPTLILGGSHRTGHARRDIAGKAVNVAHALNNLNQPCRVVGFHFNENGDLLAHSLEEAGIPYERIPVEGSIRTNIKIFEESSQVMTEINHPGDSVPQEAIDLLLQKIQESQKNPNSLLILSGSLPVGANPGIYGEIIAQSLQSGTPVILDTYGEALLKGLEAGPYIIKPNLFELESTFSVSLPTRDAQLAFCQELLARYKSLYAICLSLGGDGAIIVGKTQAFFASALNIPVQGVQGAGDSLVAGMVLEILLASSPPLDEMLRSAMAMAAASLICKGTQIGSLEDFEAMRKCVQIVKI